jgi:hypothetical protein
MSNIYFELTERFNAAGVIELAPACGQVSEREAVTCARSGGDREAVAVALPRDPLDGGDTDA